jgi:hypothetical protein
MVGFIGEVAVQILCTMAWQKSLDAIVSLNVTISSQFEWLTKVPFIPVLEFLQNLLGKSFAKIHNREIEILLEGAYVRVNQFVKTFRKVDRSMLSEYFLRASGICCKENQFGVDIVLPIVCLKSVAKEERKQATIDLTSAPVSCIMLQVKLWKDELRASYINECFAKLLTVHSAVINFPESTLPQRKAKKLNPENRDDVILPAVSIVVDVRKHESTSKASHSLSSEQVHHANKGKGRMKSGTNESKAKNGCEVKVVSNNSHPNILQLHVTGLSPLDIFPTDVSLYESFQRILESQVDPSISPELTTEDQSHVLSMFSTQPYNKVSTCSKDSSTSNDMEDTSTHKNNNNNNKNKRKRNENMNESNKKTVSRNSNVNNKNKNSNNKNNN